MATIDELCQSDTYKRLVEAVARGAIAFIGAGPSIPLGYPPWGELLNLIAEEAGRYSPAHPELAGATANDDVLVRAEIYCGILGDDRLGRLVASIYGPKSVQCNALHRSLVATPYLHFLTTNYEDSLEAAQAEHSGEQFHRFDFDEAEKRAAFLGALRRGEKERFFVHLHGSVQRPDQIILTLGQYRKRYTNANDVNSALLIIHSRHSLVFIGYGLTDYYVMHDLDVFTGHDGNSEPRHFAITTLPIGKNEAAVRQTLEKRYGITPLFYDPNDHHHDLPILLERLRQDSIARKKEIEFQRLEPLLSEIFSDDSQQLTLPEAKQRLRAAFAPALTSTISVPSTATDNDARVALDDDIDAIAKRIKEGKPSIAIALLTNLIERSPLGLTGRLRYRLYANRGNAYLTLGENERAAEEYLVAASFWRSKDSRALEALAYSLKGDSQRALQLSEAILAEDPNFPRAHSIRLRSMPKGSEIRFAMRSVPRKLRRNPEIAIALGGIAGDAGNHRLQEAYARAALANSPDWGEAWISLGVAILLSEKSKADIDIELGLVPNDRVRLEEAEAAFSNGLKFLSGEVSPQHQRAAYFNRASVRQMLGGIAGAREDLHRAYALGPNEPEIVARVAMQHEQAEQLEVALEVLQRYPDTESQPSTAFVLAFILFRRKGPGDLDRAQTVLSRIVEDGGTPSSSFPITDAIELLSAVYVAQSRRDKAIELFESLPPSRLSPALRSGHLARLLWDGSEDDKRRSAELITRAAQEAQTDSDWFARRQVGYFAAGMNHLGLAFRLLRSVTTTRRFNFDTMNMLRLARATGEDAELLNFCAQLRSNGIRHREAVRLEVETLLRCSEVDAAIRLMKDWLTHEPSDREMRLNLSAVGLHRDDPSLIESDPTKLPSAEEITHAAHGFAAVAVLQHGPTPEAAIRFVYSLWRRFPDDMETQRLLIGTVLQAGSGRSVLEPPTAVDAMSAVTCREEGTSEDRTFVVEQGNNPRATLHELSRESELVQALWGKQVGGPYLASGQRYTILAVENKIAFRARRCLQDFQAVFGLSGGIQRFTLPDNIAPGTDPKVALGDMWNVLSAQDRHRQHLVGLYKQASLPVAALSHALGRSVFETMLHLASTPELGILTALGNDDEWNAALQALQGTNEIVLDDSAVATLFLLNLQQSISSLPIRLIVPESAVQSLRDYVRRQTTPQSAGYIAVRNGQLVLQEQNPEEHEIWLRRLREFIRALVEHCEIVGGRARLELPPEVRQQLPETVGYAVTDAVAIAKARNLPIWTDDLHTAALICTPLGVGRVWAQPFLLEVQHRSPRGPSSFNGVPAKLFQFGYQFTRLNGEAIIDIFAANAWEGLAAPVLQVLKFIASVGGLNVRNRRITAFIVIRIWFRCRKRAKATRLIASILEGIGRPTAGPRIARPIYRSLCPQGLSVQRWRRLCRWLRKWRSFGS